MLVATDRLSAFDRGICSVPNKGQVLNRLAAFWHRYAGIGVLNDFGRAGGKREREREGKVVSKNVFSLLAAGEHLTEASSTLHFSAVIQRLGLRGFLIPIVR